MIPLWNVAGGRVGSSHQRRALPASSCRPSPWRPLAHPALLFRDPPGKATVPLRWRGKPSGGASSPDPVAPGAPSLRPPRPLRRDRETKAGPRGDPPGSCSGPRVGQAAFGDRLPGSGDRLAGRRLLPRAAGGARRGASRRSGVGKAARGARLRVPPPQVARPRRVARTLPRAAGPALPGLPARTRRRRRLRAVSLAGLELRFPGGRGGGPGWEAGRRARAGKEALGRRGQVRAQGAGRDALGWGPEAKCSARAGRRGRG